MNLEFAYTVLHVAEKFIAKVGSGRAHSRETYSDMLTLRRLAQAELTKAGVTVDLRRTFVGVTIKPDDRKDDPMNEQLVEKFIEAAVQTGFLQAAFKILVDEPELRARLAKVVSDALKKG